MKVTEQQAEHRQLFTPARKLHALAFRFYQGDNSWLPTAGDFYTLTRAGVELFQIDRIEDGRVYISHCENGPAGDFPQETFKEGFGVNRVHVPAWLFEIAAERL